MYTHFNMKQVETQLSDQEYEVLKSYKEDNGFKTDYQAVKELVRALDTPEFIQEFEAKRGRKSRLERAVTHERQAGVEFIERHFGESDRYDRSDKNSLKKRVMQKARMEGRNISVTDFDKWWFDPITRKSESGRQFGQEVDGEKEDNVDRTNLEQWVSDLNLKNLG